MAGNSSNFVRSIVIGSGGSSVTGSPYVGGSSSNSTGFGYTAIGGGGGGGARHAGGGGAGVPDVR